MDAGASPKTEVDTDLPTFSQASMKLEPESNYSTDEASDSSDEMSTIAQYHEYIKTRGTCEDRSDLVYESDSDDELYHPDPSLLASTISEQICGTLKHSPSKFMDGPAVSPLRTGKQTKDAHVCRICGKTSQTARKFKAHLQCHTDKRYQCSICGISLKSKGNLKRHTRLHDGEKPFKCTKCNTHFDRSESLKRHLRTHTGEKPYECTVCGRGFSTSGNLTNHKRLHTGETPYTCQLCGVGFSWSESLKRHMAKHTGKKSHVCTTCGKSFLLPRDVKTHMRNHIELKPPIYSTH